MAKPQKRRTVGVENAKEVEKDHLSVESDRAPIVSIVDHAIGFYFDFAWSAWGWPRPTK